MRRSVIVALLFLAGLAAAQTWQWGPQAGFRLTRFDGEYFPGTNKVYFLGGRLGTTGLPTDSTVWSYDPVTQAYANMGVGFTTGVSNYDAVLLRDNWDLAAGDTYGLYVFGGRNPLGVMTNAVQVYHPRTNTVATVMTDPFPGTEDGYIYLPGAAVACGNKAYVFGGFYQNAGPYVSKKTYVYDPLAAAGSRWTQLADLSRGRGYIISGVIDSVIYACGGDTFNGSSLYAQQYCEKFNTLNPGGGWTAVADMPVVAGETRGIGFNTGSPYIAPTDPALALAGKMVVPGIGQWPYEDSISLVYDAGTNSWSYFPKLIFSRRNHAVALIPGSAGTNGVPGMWVWGGRHTSDYWTTDSSEYFQLRVAGDVGCTRVLAPSGTLDSGTSVTPACSVYNYGGASETYLVFCRIGSYRDSVTVSGHGAGTRRLVTFRTWVARPRGDFTVVCSTALAGDRNTSNDRATASGSVRVADAAVLGLVSPPGLVDSGATVPVRLAVANNGTGPATFWMRVAIEGGYQDTLTYVGMPAGMTDTVDFEDWNPPYRGRFRWDASVLLGDDMAPQNDTMSGSITVRVHDVGTVRITAPAALIRPGAVAPTAWVRNYGTEREAATVTFAINSDPAYFETVDLPAGLPVGTDTLIQFPAWTAGLGSYVARCSTWSALDNVPDNDVKTREFRVTLGEPGWAEVISLPAGTKAVKDGGWLAIGEERGLVYAAKGNKSPEFYCFSARDSAWQTLAPIPGGTEGKPPSKGAVGCVGGDNVYMTKGANTPGFWGYSISGRNWTQLADVPLGPSGHKVKGGTDMVYVVEGDTGWVYLLKGYKTDFFRFNTKSGVWDTTMPAAPTGANAKWDKGSWLVSDGAGTFFAHKAKYHELWTFDVATHTWGGAALPGMPTTGSTGKTKKSKEGGCAAYLDGGLYALKGGNTTEFWRYTIAGRTWTELETIPGVGSTGKKKRVKAGGDIVAWGEGTLYALKGNKTNEFWRYLSGAAFAPLPQRGGAMAAQTAAAGEFRVASPARGGAGVNWALPGPGAARVLVLDVTGRVCAVRTLASRVGSARLELGGLSAGVYLVKLEAAGFTASRKLVVE